MGAASFGARARSAAALQSGRIDKEKSHDISALFPADGLLRDAAGRLDVLRRARSTGTGPGNATCDSSGPGARQFPERLRSFARQACQGHRHQPHPQHHGHCRRALGHRGSVAAAGDPRGRPPRGLGAAHHCPPLDSGTCFFRRFPDHHHAGQLASRLVQPAYGEKL